MIERYCREVTFCAEWNVVRVSTQGVRQAGGWVIIDHSGGLTETDFQVAEHDDNDDER